MNRCKTCKYFSIEAYFPDGMGICDSEKINGLPGLDSAYVRDRVENIYVGPDFGCIHHEERKA